MTKLLILGTGPLFEQDVRYLGAQSLRTWAFVEPLLQEGHAIRLVTLPLFERDRPEMLNSALMRKSINGFEYQAFSNGDVDFALRTLTRLARSFRPEGILSINSFPSWIAAQLPVRVPMWADLNGYEMAEKQGLAAAERDDSHLERAWRIETLVARRADKFSVVSGPQLHAQLGELAELGRLNSMTFHYQFVHHVPNAFHPMPDASESQKRPSVLRGPVVPQDALVVLWSGGYNYWTDPDRLFEFTESLMAAEPRVHYVSTGGAIDGYNNGTYERFVQRVEQSSSRDRYHLLGWVAGGDLPAIYADSDVGLNFDEPSYETLFGARNRLTNLMASGVPVVTTPGTEISQMVEEVRCGLVRPASDKAGLLRATLEILHSPEMRQHMAEAGRRCARERFTSAIVTEAARAWAREPRFSPDNYRKIELFPQAVSLLETPVNRLQREAMVLHDFDLDDLLRARAELDGLRAHPIYRTLRGARNAFMAPLDWARAVFGAASADGRGE